MFRPSETANELLRRVHPIEGFDLKPGKRQPERINFGDSIELQNTDGNVTEMVLSVALQFAAQFGTGLIVHVSTANNLYNSLSYSRFDVTASALEPLRAAERVRTVVVSSSLQLVALFETLKISLHGVPTLILLENIVPLLLAHKPTSNFISNPLSFAFSSLQDLLRSEVALAVWVTETASSKTSLREGSNKDPLVAAWRRGVTRCIHCTS